MALPGGRRWLASLAALLALLPALPAQAGLICRTHGHTATASFYLLRSYAETQARQRWIAQVTAHDGQAWAALSAARNASAGCRREGWLRWACSVSGEPCREASGSSDRLLVAPPRRDPSVKLDVNIPLTAAGVPFRAMLVLLAGGHGRLALTRTEPTQPTQLGNNLLVRMRRLLTREGLSDGPFITVLVDAANDMQSTPLMFGNYRRTQPHAEDVAAAVAAAQQDYGPLPVFLVGISAGAAGVANAAQRLGPSVVRGVVLLSAVTQPNAQGVVWIVAAPDGENAVPAGQIDMPMLFVHHQGDECTPLSPYAGTGSLVVALLAAAKDATLATITGGVAEPGVDGNGAPLACNSGNGHHSFQGAEAEVLARIAAWVNTKLP
jgi:hypothetical protein